MKIKVSEASEVQLDWMVAKCLGITPVIKLHKWYKAASLYPYCGATIPLEYSTRWSQGGPLIEREGINISVDYQDYPLSADIVAIGWKANLWNNSAPGTAGFLQWAYGPTPLIAAMRCYVLSRLGKEVEVPDELA